MKELSPYTAQRNHPWLDFHREMDQLLSDFWGVPAQRATTDPLSTWSPACDIEEHDQHFLITLETAGVPKDQIRIDFQNDQIVISGERSSETKRNDKGSSYTERRYGKFRRAFALPPGIDAAKAEAQYQDGVLSVYLPKAEVQSVRSLKIGERGAPGFFGKSKALDSKKEKEELHSNSGKPSLDVG